MKFGAVSTIGSNTIAGCAKVRGFAAMAHERGDAEFAKGPVFAVMATGSLYAGNAKVRRFAVTIRRSINAGSAMGHPIVSMTR